ncbi:16S rRNA (cytidine(1402)-2'-O)-methyltransferase [Desulfolutivibrio sulfoxidireducens]|uniref:16S rRNA (cytidine(1402)-2'-O)-methyltransferase n=1 Tax=Desulfolutivibrio sulfoxidireducens TaxID=2773299 RepID=UPI001FE50002|nr:16S rRNA (cytidine(1402)-2'-O)-methyltransferase [Desulfolutivibrio sulfoxidireducens]
MDEGKKGKLYVVATPLGNADDLSPRAARILAGADLVLAEDTRRTGLLLKRLGIAARGFSSLHEHNEEARQDRVLGLLSQGLTLALVSDAGTPLVSDPGYRLVRACRQAGYAVSPVPGPSAVTAALSAAGVPPYPFTFLGFLPRKTSDIRRLFAKHADTGATLVFFERKTRLGKALGAALDALGERECVIAREMTKTFEEFLGGRLSELAAAPPEVLGEVTVVVGPGACGGEASSAEEVLRIAAEEARAGLRPRETARRTAARVRGWSVAEVYDLVASSGS